MDSEIYTDANINNWNSKQRERERDLQLGMIQGRNLKSPSSSEKDCFQPGSHSQLKKKVLFCEALQLPFPHSTALQTLSTQNHNKHTHSNSQNHHTFVKRPCIIRIKWTKQNKKNPWRDKHKLTKNRRENRSQIQASYSVRPASLQEKKQ